MGLRVRLFLFDNSGQDLIEYALVAFLLGLSAIASLHSVSSVLQSVIASVGSSITSAI